MWDQKTVMDIANRYAKEVEKVIQAETVILYGSYAKGNTSGASDIDIAVIVNGLSEDWLEVYTKLYKLTRDISLDIEPILLDTSQDKTGFIGEIRRTGIVLA